MIDEDMEMKAYARLKDYAGVVEVALIGRSENGRKWAAKPVEFEEVTPSSIRRPTIQIETRVAQMLMDELWTCGLRPSEGTGSAGALAATQRHLDDMRKIVFDRLKIK